MMSSVDIWLGPTTSRCPLVATIVSGVYPLGLVIEISTPLSSSVFIT